ncbi:unnamed protein product [Nyctereutes procyonoides]|uniref:(raccoon dog) hypothetical protein n=1 Tax=Nyctereutes procyonoides TaxID=34880 RepID=A0A811Z0S9_NYCPR|nr:unnamed protein product [Nyctereutes procyonoides]
MSLPPGDLSLSLHTRPGGSSEGYSHPDPSQGLADRAQVEVRGSWGRQGDTEPAGPELGPRCPPHPHPAPRRLGLLPHAHHRDWWKVPGPGPHGLPRRREVRRAQGCGAPGDHRTPRAAVRALLRPPAPATSPAARSIAAAGAAAVLACAGMGSAGCTHPGPHAQPLAGAQVFAERAGWGPREHPALFLQATPHPDISRRVASFRFKMCGDRHPELRPQAPGWDLHSPSPLVPGTRRPCSHTELLLAACTSDLVSPSCRSLFSQRPLFWRGSRGPGLHPYPAAPRRPGGHFGEAWLGCAPHFQEFSRAYAAAHTSRPHPCEVALD